MLKKNKKEAQSASMLLWLKTEKLPRVVSWWPEHAPILPQTAATSFQCHLVNFFLFNFTQHFLDMSIIYFCLFMCTHTNTNSIFMELYDDGLRLNSRQEIAFIWQKRWTWQKMHKWWENVSFCYLSTSLSSPHSRQLFCLKEK